jgi:hypothetical protein
VNNISFTLTGIGFGGVMVIGGYDVGKLSKHILFKEIFYDSGIMLISPYDKFCSESEGFNDSVKVGFGDNGTVGEDGVEAVEFF